MTDIATTSAPSALDLAGYHTVLVVRTGDVGGHAYRRGSRHTVDGATLSALRQAGLIDDAQTRAAGPAPAVGGPGGGH